MKYPAQFRRDAIELVNSTDRTLRQVVGELEVNRETVRSRVDLANANPAFEIVKDAARKLAGAILRRPLAPAIGRLSGEALSSGR